MKQAPPPPDTVMVAGYLSIDALDLVSCLTQCDDWESFMFSFQLAISLAKI